MAFLKLDPNHADARVCLLEATEGLLTQLQDAQSELYRVGIENEEGCTRVAELETQLEQVQAELKKVRGKLKKAESDNEALRARMAGLEDRYERVGSYNETLRTRVAELEDKLKDTQVLEVSQKPQGDLWASPVDDKEMVRIPAGQFLHGDEKEERELSEFWIDKTPVTNAEYVRFVDATGHEPPRHWKGETSPKDIADHPVVHVSWHDAVAYAEWAGKRLPTEEEWEKAARGTDGQEYPWGEWEEERCNSSEAGVGDTTPVGKYSPDGDSPYGCVDMAGNVWEWTASGARNRQVLCGGSFVNGREDARCACRIRGSPDGDWNYGGFRLVVSPISPTSGH